ncbi:Uncharacterised protein [Clostridium fallax]|uniref:Uncharacterized protein n=2 Tax=Clostridium fallax TaxID=1533 RepID=A0A1M4T8P3_9CLOT|nr:hypothetical protein SAMN05443638_10270 [Clostridium fallax]SQB22649.1 Uncharacterised protein [Clostridium fallax]
MMESRKRGVIVNCILIFYIIRALLYLVTPFTNQSVKTLVPEKVLSKPAVIFYTVLGLVMILIIIGVFLWNKIAIYLFGTVGILIGGATLIIENISAMAVLGAAVEIILTIMIAFILLKRINLPVPKIKEDNEDDIWK